MVHWKLSPVPDVLPSVLGIKVPVHPMLSCGCENSLDSNQKSHFLKPNAFKQTIPPSPDILYVIFLDDPNCQFCFQKSAVFSPYKKLSSQQARQEWGCVPGELLSCKTQSFMDAALRLYNRYVIVHRNVLRDTERKMLLEIPLPPYLQLARKLQNFPAM